uniref:Uncharacterized protein n=1 Tax=Parascaris equorum TaxID=6256 RepID=A0A914RMU6_PAREQ
MSTFKIICTYQIPFCYNCVLHYVFVVFPLCTFH